MNTIIQNEIARLKFIQAHLRKWACIKAVVDTAETSRPISLYKALADYNALVR